MDDRQKSTLEIIRYCLGMSLTVAAILMVVILFIAMWRSRFDPVLTELVIQNFRVIVGLPFSAMAAFVVVSMFRQSESSLELEGLGFKFKGAAGEIVLWNLTFGSITGAIWLLWGP